MIAISTSSVVGIIALSVALVPGKIDPTKTKEILCAKGYTTKSVRPPTSYTDALKIKQMKKWHLPGDPSQYEEDHANPLCLSGNPTSEDNLYPQLWPDARRKDVIEVLLHRCVCQGKISLQRAQKLIWPNWELVYKFHLKHPTSCPQ